MSLFSFFGVKEVIVSHERLSLSTRQPMRLSRTRICHLNPDNTMCRRQTPPDHAGKGCNQQIGEAKAREPGTIRGINLRSCHGDSPSRWCPDPETSGPTRPTPRLTISLRNVTGAVSQCQRFCNWLHPDSVVAPTARPHPREAGRGILRPVLAEVTITPLGISAGAPRYPLSLNRDYKAYMNLKAHAVSVGAPPHLAPTVERG